MDNQEKKRADRRRHVAQVWFIIRCAFCVPCALFAFNNCTVFLNYSMEALKMLGVLACLLVIVTTWEDAKRGFDND